MNQWKLTGLTVENIVFTDEWVKIDWITGENIVFTDELVKINWFNGRKYSFHWCISEN